MAVTGDFIKFESFMRKFQMGKYVSLDLSGLRPAFNKLRDSKGRFIGKAAGFGKLLEAIQAGSEFGIKDVAYKIYHEYEKILKRSSNPIVASILETLGAVCNEMQQMPKKYFNVKVVKDDKIEVRARPFNLQVYNKSTLKDRQSYYRPRGIVRTKYKDYDIAPLFIKNPLYGRNSGHVGMGVLFEFGRASAGTIRPGQEAKDTIERVKPTAKQKAQGKKAVYRKRKIKGTQQYAYYTVLPQASVIKEGKKDLKFGKQKRALLIPVGKNEYVFRSQSRWGAWKGMHVIYEQQNVIKEKYVKAFMNAIELYLRNFGFTKFKVTKA